MVISKVEENIFWVVFHQTHDLIIKYEDNAFGSEEITREQFLILWMMKFMDVDGKSPVTITDLTSSLIRNVNSISAIVDRMEKRGLIKKIRDLPDRRAIRLTMTEKGIQVYKSALKQDKQIRKKIISIFSDKELRTLVALLKKMKKRITEENGLSDIKIDPEFSDRSSIAKFLKNKLPTTLRSGY
jgi:DNA-binding MarR family transcriptional regulator